MNCMKFDYRKIAKFFRKKKIKRIIKKKRILIDDSVSIISNNCVGGTMYNDLGLQFKSPTINLYFDSGQEFLYFAQNLKEYICFGEVLPTERKESKKDFPNSPLGLLRCKSLPELTIHFLHYHSFEEAKIKWCERCSRVNFGNIFLVIEAVNDNEKKLIEEYLKLPYKKVIFTNNNFENKEVENMVFYKKYGTGDKYPILKFTSIFGARGYDSYDFIDKIFAIKKEGCC